MVRKLSILNLHTNKRLVFAEQTESGEKRALVTREEMDSFLEEGYIYKKTLKDIEQQDRLMKELFKQEYQQEYQQEYPQQVINEKAFPKIYLWIIFTIILIVLGLILWGIIN